MFIYKQQILYYQTILSTIYFSAQVYVNSCGFCVISCVCVVEMLSCGEVIFTLK